MSTVEPVAPFDLVIAGGDVVDGSGGPRRRADVGVVGDRIVAIGDLGAAAGTARAQIDATGRVVSPGFIDVHAHSELAILANTADATAISVNPTPEQVYDEARLRVGQGSPDAPGLGVRMDWDWVDDHTVEMIRTPNA